ncbi:MAG TPA: PspC domain-containing protein [Solirubrobacteraceae bacterium]|nr:PspC domain-containing protein [Solirubrobacteraceae bacterium]
MTETPPQNPEPEPERETPGGETPGDGEPRRLTRSGGDAIIGGVASGLGRYFGVDPILFRIGFVVATFIGAVGLIAYIALLIFVPTDGEEKTSGPGKAVAVAGAVVLGCLLVTFLSPPVFIFGPGLLVLGLIGLAGFLLWRAVGGNVNGDPARTVGKLALAALIGVAIAGAALGVGLAAALGGGVVIASLAVVAGLALIGTAFVGGARWLIVPALALVLPLGIVSAAGIDLDGGVGDRDYHPASVAQLRDHYEVGIGSLTVDMTDVDLPANETTDLALDVGLGEAVLYVPSDTCVSSDVQIGVGASDVLDRDNDGVDVKYLEDSPAPAGRPKLHINADVGVGVIEVVREGFVRDQFSNDHWSDSDRSFGLDDGGTHCA